MITSWSDLDEFIGDCPHCSIRALSFEYLSSALDERDINSVLEHEEIPLFVSASCSRCKNPVLYRVLFKEVSANRAWFLIDTCYPTFRGDERIEDSFSPKAVVNALNEAIMCHSVGAQVGATLVLRRVIQLITRGKGASGGNLAEEINSLDIPQELKDIAHSSRLIGNEAAHPNPSDWERIEATDVALLIDLITQMIQQLYVIPGQAKQLLKRANEVAGRGDATG